MRYRKTDEHDSALGNKFTRTLFCTASAMTLAVSAASVSAQTAEPNPENQPETAEAPAEGENIIIVTGFRQSLSDALDSKRNSGNITDVISSEDIGKSTDKNIAEALQRVTGVSISREDGEGTSVVVRGASSDLNNITLNGVPLTSGGANQSVDLSNFSSDVISSIEVVKTPSADHDEGSLGATVRLNTFKPLDVGQNRRVIELQTSYSPFEDEDFIIGDDFFGGDYRANLAFSQKLLDNRLGISIVATTERRTTRKDRVFSNSYPLYNAVAGATNLDTGQVITQFDYGNGLENLRGAGPADLSYSFDRIQRDRTTINGSIQYQPGDNTDIQINATYTRQDTDRNISRYQINPDQGNRQPGLAGFENALVFDPSTLTFVRNVQTALSTQPNGQNRNREPAVFLAETVNREEQTTFVLSGEIEQRLGDFTFALSGGHSETQADNPYNFFVRFNNARPRRTDRAIGVDCGTTPDLCQFVLPQEYIDDASLMRFQTSSVIENVVSDVSDSVYFDMDWDQSFGPISSFEAGFKWSSRTKDVQANSTRFNNFETGGVLTSNGLTLADFVRNGRTPGDFGQAFDLNDPTITNGWFQVDGDLVFQTLEASGITPVSQINLRNTRAIENEVFGGYVKANLDMFDGRVIGDIGLRAVKTNVNSRGFSGFNYNPAALAGLPENAGFNIGRDTLLSDPPPTETVATHSYTNYLPSLNLNWLATEDLIIRFAASQTIARPRIDDTKPGFDIVEDIFRAESRGTIGSPFLNPFESTNLDLSVEWYFAEESLLSLALFNKNLSNFAETNSFQSYYIDARSEFYDATGNLLPADQIDFVADVSNVLLPFDGGPNQAGCMPNREQDLTGAFGPAGCDLLIVTQARNGTGGYVRGAELSFQHNFTYLPGIFSGLGIVANYTYSDSQADAEFDDLTGVQTFAEAPLLGTSKHTFNVTGFYERNGVLLRLAYNKRSDFLVSRSTRNGHSQWRDGGQSLDLSANIDVTDYMSFNFQAVNLTDDVRRDYVKFGTDANGVVPAESFDFGGLKSRTIDIQNTGRVFRFGARLQF